MEAVSIQQIVAQETFFLGGRGYNFNDRIIRVLEMLQISKYSIGERGFVAGLGSAH